MQEVEANSLLGFLESYSCWIRKVVLSLFWDTSRIGEDMRGRDQRIVGILWGVYSRIIKLLNYGWVKS